MTALSAALIVVVLIGAGVEAWIRLGERRATRFARETDDG